jgi:hypothetical protein
MKPREQGDIGEMSAMYLLASIRATVSIPVGHSPDDDLVAEIEGRLLRVQVKTCTCRSGRHWMVSVCTRGGNQSWNGIVKRLDASRCEYPFVLTADGRRWFIPSDALGGGITLRLAGPKYAQYEVERRDAIAIPLDRRARSRIEASSRWGDARVAKGIAL